MTNDMANSCATINVAKRYIICSDAQGACHAETDRAREKTPGARFQHRAADHGAAGLAGAALEPAHCLGIARRAADLTRAARRLRRRLADDSANPARRFARSEPGRARAGERLSPDVARPRAVRHLYAAASLRGAMEQAFGRLMLCGRDRQAGAVSLHDFH